MSFINFRLELARTRSIIHLSRMLDLLRGPFYSTKLDIDAGNSGYIFPWVAPGSGVSTYLRSGDHAPSPTWETSNRETLRSMGEKLPRPSKKILVML